MSNKLQTTLVGAFVLVAVLLTVVLLLLFGGGKLFSSNVEYTVFFNKSVKGLTPGAPVMFRGVRIGQVKSIGMSPAIPDDYTGNSGNLEWPIRVVLELSPNSLGSRSEWQAILPESLMMMTNSDPRVSVRKLIEHLVIERGMKVRLQTSSLLTGQLFVEMNLYPEDGPASEEIRAHLAKGILPTSMSVFESLFLSLEDKKLGNQVENVYILIEQLGQFVQDGHFQQLLEDVRVTASNVRKMSENGTDNLDRLGQQSSEILAHLDEILGNLDGQLGQLITEARGELQSVSHQATKTARQIGDTSELVGRLAVSTEEVVNESRPQVQEILANLRNATDQLEETLAMARETAEQLRGMSGVDSGSQANLNATLQEIDQTASALRSLAEYLQRHPDALLRGR